MRTDPDIARTPAAGCEACAAFRLHTEEELAAFHPYARHGYTRETGWTHPDLEAQAHGR